MASEIIGSRDRSLPGIVGPQYEVPGWRWRRPLGPRSDAGRQGRAGSVTVTLIGEVVGIEDGDGLDPRHRHPDGDLAQRDVYLLDRRPDLEIGVGVLEGSLELVQAVAQHLEIVSADQSLPGNEAAGLGQSAGLVCPLPVAPPAVPSRPTWTARRRERRPAPGASKPRSGFRAGCGFVGFRHCVESNGLSPSLRGSPVRGSVAPMANVSGFGGVVVYTSAGRFESMRAFYVDGLGLRPRSDRPGFVNFELGDQRLTVAVHSEIAGPNRDPLHVMVNLTTADADAAYSAAVVAGATPLRSPSPEPWGGLVATVRDPDGNVVQFLQLPSPVAG